MAHGTALCAGCEMTPFSAKLADDRQRREWAEWKRELAWEDRDDDLASIRPGPSCACADRLREECARAGMCQEGE